MCWLVTYVLPEHHSARDLSVSRGYSATHMTTQVSHGDPGITYAELALLKHLVLEGNADRMTKSSRSSLANELHLPVQTVSNQLRQLEKNGLIERLTENGEQEISINDHGLSVLRREYELYRRIFDAPEVVELTGTVCMGLGEGQYFVSLPGYKKQFETRLGYEPFEGTLNVELTSESVRRRSAIGHMNAILIEGWEGEERTYGPVVCYPATLRLTHGEQYEPAHIVAPKRTHHDEDQLEVLAPDELREVLSLEEGDQVTVHVKER